MKETVNLGYLVYQYVERNGKMVKVYVQKGFTPRTEKTIDVFSTSIKNAERFKTYEEAEKIAKKYPREDIKVEEDVWTLNVKYENFLS